MHLPPLLLSFSERKHLFYFGKGEYGIEPNL